MKSLNFALTKKGTIRPFYYVAVLGMIYFGINLRYFSQYSEKTIADELQAEVLKFELISKDNVLLKKYSNFEFKQLDENQLKALGEYNYFIQVYHRDSFQLKFWSQISPRLDPSFVETTYNGSRYIKLNDINYLVCSKTVGTKIVVLGYNIDNYLQNNHCSQFHFFEQSSERKDFKILKYSSTASHNIVDSKHQYLFSFQKSDFSNDFFIIVSMFLIFLMSSLTLKSIDYFSKTLSVDFPIVASVIFILIIVTWRKMFLYFKFPGLLYKLKLFNPSLYSSDLTPSLGDLFIFIIGTQVIMFFINRNLKINLNILHKYKMAIVFHSIAIAFMLGESFSVNKIFERLVVESSIWFNFNYFPRLSVYSFVGLSIMLLTFSNYYLLSNFIIKHIVNLKLKSNQIILSFSVVYVLIILIHLFANFKLVIIAIFYVLFIFLIISYLKYYHNYRSRIFNTLQFLIFASTITCFLLHYNNNKKEQVVLSSIASNIIFGRDKGLESKIIEKLKCIKKSSLTDCVHDTLTKNFSFKSIDELDYIQAINNFSNDPKTNPDRLILNTSQIKLFFLHIENDKKYLAEISLDNGKKEYCEIYPLNYLNSISSNTKREINEVIIRDNSINYALYDSDTLIESSGKLPYNLRYSFDQNIKSFHQKIANSNFEHHIFSYHKLKVVVTTDELGAVSVLIQFSYIFCFNLMLFLIFRVLGTILKLNNNLDQIKLLGTLRNKIVASVFLIVVMIFAGIMYLSYNSLKLKYNEYNREVLLNNLHTVQASIESLLYGQSNTFNNIQNFIIKLSDDQDLNVNIYDNKGHELSKSDRMYQVNETINPLAYWKFSTQNTTSFESIKTGNNVIFKSLNVQNNLTYILSISSQNKINRNGDATRLLVVLLNLYVILFLIAMLIAFWMANRITKPLSLIADKISKIQISKQNEYIDYQYDDEIGELVKKYNTMVDEIDRSTKLLASHEREEAWSEMAKQIAHEIKNPLTPMKLKIQFLQRKIKDGNENIREFTLGVADTLIEQIDNLENIATSFSNFAKLHQVNLETLDWIPIIRNVMNVFENPGVSIHFESKLETAIINCDQNQMVSSLNNLIKNAIQSFENSEAKLEIRLMDIGKNYRLDIQDFGKGISSENLEKIFTPNFTTKSSGTGLGLAITKKIIESIDGKIEVISEENIGSTFSILIPKHKL